MAMFGALPRATSLLAQPGYGAPQGSTQPTQSPPQYQSFAPIGGIAPTYRPGLSEKLAAISGIFSQLGGIPNDAFSQYQQNAQQQRLMQQKAQAEAAKLYQPQDVGGSLVRLNPQTGKYEAVYTPDPKPANQPEIIQLAAIANDANQPDYARKAASDRIAAMNDPVVTMPGGGMALRSTVTGLLNNAGSGPAPGTIRNGYRFKGGNPQDQNAWEPIGGATPSASGGFRR